MDWCVILQISVIVTENVWRFDMWVTSNFKDSNKLGWKKIFRTSGNNNLQTLAETQFLWRKNEVQDAATIEVAGMNICMIDAASLLSSWNPARSDE